MDAERSSQRIIASILVAVSSISIGLFVLLEVQPPIGLFVFCGLPLGWIAGKRWHYLDRDDEHQAERKVNIVIVILTRLAMLAFASPIIALALGLPWVAVAVTSLTLIGAAGGYAMRYALRTSTPFRTAIKQFA